MAFLKRWKTNWELKSLTLDQLFNVIVEIVTKQLDEVEKSEVTLDANLVIDYEADSVDVVAMLLYLEDMFKNASQTTRTVVPTDKLGQIVLVEDILDIIYEVLVGIESKMESFVAIKPDFDALEKRQKMGELYPNDLIIYSSFYIYFYLIVTFPPAASTSFLIVSPSSLLAPSFNSFGTLSTISFDSFKPRPVTLRTIFRIAIFLSAGTESKITSKAVFSSAASVGAAATGAAADIVPTDIEVSTPKTTSISFTNSAASNNVKLFNCSMIVSNFSLIIF
jgi:acyl carrier protein